MRSARRHRAWLRRVTTQSLKPWSYARRISERPVFGSRVCAADGDVAASPGNAPELMLAAILMLLAGFACSISLGGLKALQLTSDDAQYSEGVQYSEEDD